VCLVSATIHFSARFNINYERYTLKVIFVVQSRLGKQTGQRHGKYFTVTFKIIILNELFLLLKVGGLYFH
jgi:hypothetical protein